MEPWEKEWAELIAAAQMEGRLVIAATGGSGRIIDPIMEHFAAKYGLNIIIGRGTGTEQFNRIAAERSAGRYEVDVAMLNRQTAQQRYIPLDILTPIAPLLIHPDVLDLSKWHDNEHLYGDLEQQFHFSTVGSFSQGTSSFWINTNLVTQADIETINSYEDFLTPRWKGNIIASNPLDFVTTLYNEQYYREGLGPEFLRRFIQEQDVRFVTDLTLIEDGLALGHYPIALYTGAASRALLDLQELGLPIMQVDRDFGEPGTKSPSGTEGNLSVFENAPHVKAAQLFINWFATREGQVVYHDLQADEDPRASFRVDVPQDNVDPARLRQPGRDYIREQNLTDEQANAAFEQMQAWLGG